VAPSPSVDGDPDLLEGAQSRPGLSASARWVIVVSVAVAAGGLVGYALGHHQAATSAGHRQVTATAVGRPRLLGRPDTGPPFVQTGATCSAQHGRQLQLGIEVQNQAPSVVHITAVASRAPLPGLRPTTTRVGTCGQAHGSPPSADPSAVPGGGATWVTATVEVLVRCPGPDPLQFVVHYGQGTHAGTERLAGFVDLGNVPYSGCAHRS
jgi:hypothetical protein